MEKDICLWCCILGAAIESVMDGPGLEGEQEGGPGQLGSPFSGTKLAELVMCFEAVDKGKEAEELFKI